MGSSEMDKPAKEAKEPKTPTQQVYSSPSLFTFHFKSIRRVLLSSCIRPVVLVVFRNSLHLHLPVRPLQTGLAFRFFSSNAFDVVLFCSLKSFVSVSHLVEIVFVTGIFSYASTWVLGIKPSSSPLHVGSSGMWI